MTTTTTNERASELRRRRTRRVRACNDVVNTFARHPRRLDQAVRGIAAIDELIAVLLDDRDELARMVLDRVPDTARKVPVGDLQVKLTAPTKYTFDVPRFVQELDALVAAGKVDRKLRDDIVQMTDPVPPQPKVYKRNLDKAEALGIKPLAALIKRCTEWEDQPRKVTVERNADAVPEEALAA